MSLTGTLATMALSDLLQWLHASRKSGTLILRGDKYAKRIFFDNGDIVSSSSEDPTEHLGQFLISHGVISEDDLKMAIETQTKTGVLIGKILTMVGTLNEEDIKRYLALKVEETIFSVFLWDDAHFEFKEGELPKQILVPVSIKIDDVLAKGMSRYQELQKIRQAFGSAQAVLAPNGTPGAEFLADKRRRVVWEGLDGVRSIADIAVELHMAEFYACEVVHLLYKMDHVKLVKRGVHQEKRIEEQKSDALAEGRKLLDMGEVEKALDLVERAAVEDRESAPALRSLLKDIQDAFVDRTYRYQMPPEKHPYLLRPLEALTDEKLTPHEGFLITRINGEWTVRDVVSIAPFSEVDALRTLKSLRVREIIDLK